MVLSLLQDGHLIGFWPMNEPSGAPVFQNYGYTYGGRPSGISFNLHIHNADDGQDRYYSEWPGTNTIFNVESGVNYRGFLMQGSYDTEGNGVFDHANVLALGVGDRNSRVVSGYGDSAGSGITIGFWVMPTTDGYQQYLNTGNGKYEQARGNSVIYRGGDDIVLMAGVSGSLAGGAQFDAQEFGGPHRLTAYAYACDNKTVNPLTAANAAVVETPVESGRYTHITFSFEYVDGTNNVISIYKDGTLQSTATTSAEPSLNDANFSNAFWSIGGVTDNAAIGTFEYLSTTGFNKMVSGIYMFNRVISDAEVASIHNHGGFQTKDGRFPEPAQAIPLTDPGLVSYYGFWTHDYEDIVRNKAAAVVEQNIGNDAAVYPIPGPFNSIGLAKQDSPAFKTVASSGTLDGLVDNASFTIAGHFRFADSSIGVEYMRNMLMSLGSVGNSQTISISNSTAAFHVSQDDTNQQLLARFYPFGDGAARNVTELRSPYFQVGARMGLHVGIIYDDQTNGVALYAQGEQVASGTVDPYFRNTVTNVIGSGFPLCFLGGILDQDPDTWAANGSLNPAGANAGINSFAVFSRPLLASEMRYLAASGIDPSPLHRSPHDPRLQGYWPFSSFQLGDTHSQDLAANWRTFAGHMVFALSDQTWEDVQATDTGGPWYTIDVFGQARGDVPELASFGNLGATSGVFAVQGGSMGAQAVNTSDYDSSIGCFPTRYRPFEQSTNSDTNSPAKSIWTFEVTPSGAIPPLSDFHSRNDEFNAAILSFDDSDEPLKFYLTSINANNPDPQGADAGTGASGISIVVRSERSVLFTPLASGNLPYGVPTRVAFMIEKTNPYSTTPAATDTVRCRLYIDGVRVFERDVVQNSADIWGDDAAISLDAALQVGGNSIVSAPASPNNTPNVGLGDIYVRDVAFLRGTFSGDDLDYFVSSGIQDVAPLPGYTVQGASTAVSINDSDLRALWRFSGGQSGELDLTINSNDLTLLAKDIRDAGAFSNPNFQGAYSLRFLPGPLVNSNLGVRCSGITYGNQNITLNPVPFFAGSGVGHNPASDFSIAFRACPREFTASTVNDADVFIAYGVVPTTAIETGTNDNYSWCIYYSATEGVRFAGATNGGMYLSNIGNAAQANQIAVGCETSSAGQKDNTPEEFRQGILSPPHKDAFSHYVFTVDYTNDVVRCYMNGILVDTKRLLGGTIPQPTDPSARWLTFLAHQVEEPWAFDGNLLNNYSILTDVALFDRALTQEEALYLALNGVELAVGQPASGIIGAYVQGQDAGSGIIGGYHRGQLDASGIAGGYIPAAIISSGIAGGYVSGVVFGQGTLGGFVQGLDVVSGILGGWITGAELGSGIIAGYIQGTDTASGIMGGLIVGGVAANGSIGGYLLSKEIGSGILGGYILGGLQGDFDFDAGFTVEAIAAENFDAQLEIAKTIASDFDAKLVIFQDEAPPLVDIIVPDVTVSGLVPPFNQYFVAKASGQQGKTIDIARWNFGDFTPTVSASLSGSDCYPVQHQFTGSGFYVVRFEAIDSDGIHATATRIVNAASGVDPVIIGLSGVPRSGSAGLTVDFETTVDILPPGVSIVSQLLSYDDGQSTISFNPTHVYTEPGVYKPVWTVRDSRGVIWSDSLEAGNDFLLNGGF
jgi:hypothetical protein